MQSAKHDLMRNTNTLNLLRCIMDSGPLSKREIQEKSGLSWGAVCNIIQELLKSGVLYEFKSQEPSSGRTPSKYEISSTNHLIIGLDINIEGLTAVITDLKCRVLKKASAVILKFGRESVLNQVKELIKEILDSNETWRRNIMGIGVAMQGTVDVKGGISVYSPHFDDWNNVPLKDILQKEFNIPVFIEHDPNCIALAERWLGYGKDIDNMLFLRLSMGIGMSIIINGEVHRGADGSSGEFGHIIMDPDGPVCSCGNYGCLEVYSSGRGILKQIIHGIKLSRTSIQLLPDEDETPACLELAANAARSGDEYIKGIFQNAGAYLGIGIVNLINIFNPELVVIGGELAKYRDLFFDKTTQVIKGKTWRNSRVNLVSSELGSDSAAIGAAALFVQMISRGDISHISG